MALVQHVVLRGVEVVELAVAHDAHVAKVDLLGQVGEQALDADEAVDVKDDEVVLQSHVVQALLNAYVYVVAEKAATERGERSFSLFNQLLVFLYALLRCDVLLTLLGKRRVGILLGSVWVLLTRF